MGVPEDKKEQCKAKIKECGGKATDDEKKKCMQDALAGLMAQMPDMMGKACDKGPEDKKEQCKAAMKECGGKATAAEKMKCMKGVAEGVMGDGKKPGVGTKPGVGKKPVRKKRDVAQKGTDCAKIPKKADLDKTKCLANKDR